MRWLNPCIGLLGATLTLGCGNSDEDSSTQDNSNGPKSLGGSSNADGSAGTTSAAHSTTSTTSTSSTTAAGSTGGHAATTGVGTTASAGGAGVSSSTDGSGGEDSATASTDSQAGGAAGVDTATSTTGEPDPCYALSGQTYATVDELECGNTPAGPMLCTWTIAFTDVEFQWSRADTLQTGTYSCENGAISAEGAGQVLEGELDEDGSLMWEGQTYVLAD